ncbi:hypothetical protein PR202_gb01802 [Eleusine coracana subsp. coracana]|uniref:O-methyltransferase ZRP4 n=1 Tax=Eleusine coracana subsp. coracana TaxID=191504 RepID=A0AAV5DXM0_ELECO|nr:hypothetical protein QOZ80_5BG0414400 [Eleusine coracana subsp. coracana]GJN14925.1 hypothetical protein PR202_gb01802 [Eleusine coracana subsp. coracana]
MELSRPSSKNQALPDAQLELWHHSLCYIKSMALKSAVDLRIADAIHDNGGTGTLPQIATKIMLHQSKLPCLRRLMRVLTVTGVFSIIEHPTDGGGEHIYGLTPVSSLLWFEQELPNPTLFKMEHGRNAWDLAGHDAKFAKIFDDGMVADSSFNVDIVIKECGDVFHGISSLMDVAGGLGGASQAISKAFPHVKCSVLDLPHVVAAAPAGTNVEYIAGDMFESIPPANAIFLKWILHDWGDVECAKILKNCRNAIPPRDAGGKVVIFDMVVGAGTSHIKHRETQVLFDLFIMLVDGAERDEQEWKKIILEAGFSDYKIIPVVGVRSIIQVYP